MEANICHIINGDSILLKKATRGVSKGKWNAPGGKIDDGETPEESVKREALEETGLAVSSLLYHGKLTFHIKGKDEVINDYIFSTKTFTGKLTPSEEGELRWFDKEDIPYDQMWPDDLVWLNLMFAGKKFDGDFYFNEDYSIMLNCEIRFK